MTDRTSRAIGDEAGLLTVVLDTLGEVQDALSGPNGMATLLWDRQKKPTSQWRPKDEDDFCDLVMGLLKILLTQRRITVDREVQVDRPGTPRAGRTDIHIQATTDPDDPTPLTADQLIGRYLRRIPRSAGILLVGYFHNEEHTPHHARCTTAHTPRQIEEEQQQKAEAARHDYLVTAKVLDCRFPSLQSPGAPVTWPHA